jgi:hypothetical protein
VLDVQLEQFTVGVVYATIAAQALAGALTVTLGGQVIVKHCAFEFLEKRNNKIDGKRYKILFMDQWKL